MSEQPGQGNGVGTPERPQPAGRPPGDNAGRRAAWLGVGGLVLTLFFWPLGLVLSIAGIIVGLRARRRAAHAPGAMAGIVAGGIGAVLAAIGVASLIYVWPQANDMTRCLDSANTMTDEQACKDRYIPQIEKKFGAKPGSLDWMF
ncbi:hypothetical protein [Actinomadura macrotermitis]|uniref:DUF4190 domain-containing protein n=1 Tax=Actinomadura macrotermitis TaxID=2585200 RepID=A0A7K0C201_9ACTN|nr:hypothetical protein [Actinomadura macrotermitis]MQY07420.1 hypothetical protein [Actinomadura macrotermitis]